MKKIFTSMMLLLAIAAGMSIVSCDKQVKQVDENKPEEKNEGIEEKNEGIKEKLYTPEEQASIIDSVGVAFIQELDLDNWKATADVVIPAILFMENDDIDMSGAPAPEIETKEEKVDVANLVWTRTYTVDMSKAKGHYTINAEGKGNKESGDFKDFQIAFSADGHSYVADIEFTNSDKTVLVNYDEYETGYYNDENGQYVSCPGMVRKSSSYLVLPAKLTGYFTADDTKHFTVEGNLSYNGVEDPRELTDLKEITINVDLAVTAGDYALNLSKLSLNGGTFDEALTFKHNDNQLLELTSTALGLNIIANADDEALPYACDSALVVFDVLSKVQVKGNVMFNDFYNKYLSLATAEPKNVEEANALLAQLEPYYNLNVYYDKGSVVQASVRAKAFESEEDEMSFTAVISFQDGTSLAVPEFFTAENFGKTYAALENLVGKVQEYIQSMVPAKE